MINLDITIVNIALPAIMDDLCASLADIEWVVNIYILVFAVTDNIRKAADIFGRKNSLLQAGYFTLASLSCGLSQNIEMLIMSRCFRDLEEGHDADYPFSHQCCF